MKLRTIRMVCATFGLFLFLAFLPTTIFAESPQVLTVTPPLFQLSIAPGDIWKSSVKVVNGNPEDLTVYAEIVNFAAQGEQGQGRFIPILNEDDSNSTLAQWIEIAKGPHVIKPEQTKEIPFFVEIPEDAPPGGHFAAILIGTQPPKGDGPLIVQTSQVVTSLFFVRIEGDVVESGNIREFRTEQSLVSTPENEFVLRFENKGNVHLQPRGEIKIINMWGSERGIIPINNQTHFGNVLPESIREFHFSWKGEKSITEIGRYTAEVTLTYGQNGYKNVSAKTYFWVIPIKATLITLGSVIAFILFLAWAIRLYVRRMLAIAGVDLEGVSPEPIPTSDAADIKLATYTRVSGPITRGAHDLRVRLSNVHKLVDVFKTLYEFVKSYRVFFISVLVITIGFVLAVLFISDASKEQKSYEVTIEHDDGSTTVDSEEILKEKLDDKLVSNEPPDNSQKYTIEIENASGEAGLAAKTAIKLETLGYTVETVSTSNEGKRDKSVILYPLSLADEAVTLSSALKGVLLSSIPDTPIASSTDAITPVSQIKIILGSDSTE